MKLKENTMLKKTLVALAIASVAGSVSAADLAADPSFPATQVAPQAVSAEGTALVTTIDSTKVLYVKLGAEYTLNDTITLDFTGMDIDKATFPTTIVADKDSAFATVTFGVSGTPTKNQVQYRVTKVEQATAGGTADSTVGQYFSMPFEDDNANPTAGKVSIKSENFASSGVVSFKAVTNTGAALDTGTLPLTLLEGKTQFSADVATPFDAIIDVEEQRLKFTVGVTDAATITVTDADSGDAWSNSVDADATTFEVMADFDFLAVDSEGEIDQSSQPMIAWSGTPDSVTYAADKITATYNAGTTTTTLTIDLEDSASGFAASAISTQDFEATVVQKYSLDTDSAKKGSVTLLNGADAGNWELNGAVVHVPFMPFRAGYSPIVNVSNTSNQDGDIEVLVYAETDASWVEPMSYQLSTVVAKAESQTNITSALQALDIEGDVAFDIIVNAPKKDIEVNALFYRDGDRAVINTVKK
jgi:hypothetical protein